MNRNEYLAICIIWINIITLSQIVEWEIILSHFFDLVNQWTYGDLKIPCQPNSQVANYFQY